MRRSQPTLSGACRGWFIILGVVLWICAGVARAADLRTEVFELSRPAPPVAALIKPLLGAGGVTSALGHTLVIRAKSEMFPEIRALIERLDMPIRTLNVSVRHGRERAHRAAGTSVWSSRDGRARSGLSNGGGFGGGATTLRQLDSNSSVRVYSSRSRASSNDFSNVQVLDGGEAFISTGTQVPVRTGSVVSDGDVRVSAETIEYRDVTTGFYVRPRLVASDTEVLMEIAPSRAALASSPTRPNQTPQIRQQNVVTTVRGRVGEWLPLAANGRVRTTDGNARVRSSESLRQSNTQIFVKVDIVR